MIITSVEDEQLRIHFVEMASAAFQREGRLHTFTSKNICNECLFAVRWGLMDDAILVFRIDASTPIVVYANAIPRELGQIL